MHRFRAAAWLLVLLSSSAPAPAAEAPRRPGVIAHRGVVSEAPENTLPAIAKAIELGCDMAEIDLRYTADGEVVLLHDSSLERTTSGRGPVAARTLAELRELDAGAWYKPEFRATRIPTFKMAVELARGRIQLYLDLKEQDPLPVVRLVEELEARSFVFYRPYSYTAARQILAESPSSRLLIDIGDWAQAPAFLEALRREFPTSSLSSDWANWTPHALAEARKLGLPTLVNVLGPADTPDNLRRAVDLGFDYIQTDHPRELLAVIQGASPQATQADARSERANAQARADAQAAPAQAPAPAAPTPAPSPQIAFPGQYAAAPADWRFPVWPGGCARFEPQQRASCLEFVAFDFGRLSRFAGANAALAPAKPGEARVVFFGDSITDNWSKAGYGGFFPGRPYVNRGIGGQTTAQMLLRYRADVIALRPAAVVILAGTNDVSSNSGPMTPEQTKDNLTTMAELAKLHGIKVVLASLLPVADGKRDAAGNAINRTEQRPPRTLGALNAWLASFARDNGHVFLDYFAAVADANGALRPELNDDGLHPNAAGYAVMAPLAERAIARALQRVH